MNASVKRPSGTPGAEPVVEKRVRRRRQPSTNAPQERGRQPDRVTARGYIDAVIKGRLHGWCLDEASSTATTVRITIDGEQTLLATADHFRADLAEAGIGTGAHGFVLIVPEHYRDGGLHEFRCEALLDESIEVISERSLLSESCPNDIQGRLERVSEGYAYGWAIDLLRPEKRLELLIEENGQRAGRGLANLPRPDLREARLGDGRYGYKIRLAPGGNATTRRLLVRTTDVPTCIVAEWHGEESRQNDARNRARARSGPSPQSASQERPAVRAPTQQRVRTFEQTPFSLEAKHREDASGANVRFDGSMPAIRTDALRGWFRICHRAPDVRTLLTHDTHVGLQFRANKGFTFSLMLVERAANDTTRIARRIARKLIAEPGDNTYTLATTCHQLRSAELDQTLDAVHYAIEVAEPLDIENLAIDLRLEVPVPSTIPYQNSDDPRCSDLAALNSTMQWRCQNDMTGWMLDAAALALRLECLETAAELIDKLLLSDFTDPEQQRAYLHCRVNLAFAEGTPEKLRPLLWGARELVASDDRLYTALALCESGDDGASTAFATLPSGRLNRRLLSASPGSPQTIGALFRTANRHDDADTSVLAANAAASRHEDMFIEAWNQYLRGFDLAELEALSFKTDNVLQTLKFPARAGVTTGPMVSVLMSACNASTTCTYAVRSILDQTYRNLEILVCDDRSDDDTEAVLRELAKDPRVRLFRSNANQGTYHIRNALIREARGEYLTFQDSDDYAHPQRIEKQVSAMLESDAVACMTSWVRMQPDGQTAFFLDHGCLRRCLASIMVHRSFHDQGWRYRGVQVGADTEMYENIRVQFGPGAIVHVPQPLVFGLWSPASLTQTAGLEATRDGYLAPARRRYAETASRFRLLGEAIVPERVVEEAVEAFGISRRDAGITPAEPHR